MSKINKYENLIKDKYESYTEETRFLSKHQKVEYLTTMKYIKKYLQKGMKIIELGAGTGAYSIELAKQGYDVTAVELVKRNLNVLKKNGKKIKNLHPIHGDALDLSKFADNSFDIVLSFGPMYHLFNEKDKMQAIQEAVRICKNNGIIMFAYLTHASIVWAYGVRKNNIDKLQYAIMDNGAIKDVPEEIFSSYFIEDFKNQFKSLPIKHLKDVATDSLFDIMRDYVDELSDEKYEMLLDYHFKTCERKDMQGVSNHMLYICKKI